MTSSPPAPNGPEASLEKDPRGRQRKPLDQRHCCDSDADYYKHLVARACRPCLLPVAEQLLVSQCWPAPGNLNPQGRQWLAKSSDATYWLNLKVLRKGCEVPQASGSTCQMARTTHFECRQRHVALSEVRADRHWPVQPAELKAPSFSFSPSRVARVTCRICASACAFLDGSCQHQRVKVG